VADYGRLPLYFIENRGQVDPKVQFYARAPGQGLAFTSREVRLSLSPSKGKVSQVRLTPLGMQPTAKLEALDPQEARFNYLLGKDQSRWHTDVPSYGAVLYREAYPGIDLKFYGNGRQLEYDLIVRPGANLSRVKFRYGGVAGLQVDSEGNLVVKLADGGQLLQMKPVIYQEIGGRRVAREGRFKIMKKRGAEYGFEVAAYDKTRPMVIDPVLSYSTYFGGSGFDAGTGIALDAAGNIYVTGTTTSTNFPLQNPYQDHRASIYNQVFVSKFNPQGNALIYSTYLGGANGVQGEGKGEQWCNGIAVDQNGCAYVTGYTYSTDFPTRNPYQADHYGNQCMFVTKFNAQGDDLVYSTYLGLGGNNSAWGIAVDQDANAYIAGQSEGDFPTTPSAYQPDYGGGDWDAVVAKFNAAGSDLMYATFLGGEEIDRGGAIAVDAAGNAYVTGHTTVAAADNFPTTPGVTQPNSIGSLYSVDAFVTKLNTDGSGLVYSTFLGGTNIYDAGTTYGRGIAVDTAGNAYVTGSTDATSNFPIKNAAQPAPGGGTSYHFTDAFVTAYNPTASDYLFSTYLGGSNYDYATSIAVFTDSGGRSSVHVSGETISVNFPTKNPIQASLNIGHYDVFVTKIDAVTGALVFSTYLGGAGLDQSRGIATDRSGNTYVAGSTQSTNFPTKNPFQASSAGGGSDAFWAKIGETSNIVGPVSTLLLLE
jgi:hypothetical protein